MLFVGNYIKSTFLLVKIVFLNLKKKARKFWPLIYIIEY